jgi:hypothetical protein
MPRITVKAAELTDTNVDFVAMVKHGANRIPFRITKSEDNDMIDLSVLSRRLFQKSAPAPEVFAIVIDPSLNEVPELEGFAKSEADSLVTLAKGDVAAAKGALLVKTLAGPAMLVTLVSDTLRKAEFIPFVDADGVAMSPLLALDHFKKSVDALFGSEAGLSSAEQGQAFAAEADKFQAYVEAANAAFPKTFFDIEATLKKAAGGDCPDTMGKKKPVDDEEAKKEPAKKDGDNSPGAAVVASTADKDRAEGTDDEAKALETKNKVAKLETPGPDASGADVGSPVVDDTSDSDGAAARGSADDKKLKQNEKSSAQKSDAGEGVELEKSDAIMSALATLSKTVSESIAAVVKSVDEVKASQASLNDRVENVAVMAKKTDAALNGTVFNEAGEDGRAPARKAEQARELPLLDTAYNR